jgi:NhaA family Na+:H+ antiporter
MIYRLVQFAIFDGQPKIAFPSYYFVIMRLQLTTLFREFFNSEKAGGLLLICCTVISIILTNSSWGPGYTDFWHHYLGFTSASVELNLSITHWVNDGLMAVFFLLVGLEIERELYVGELSDFRNALLPALAAIGGMAIPAVLYWLINSGSSDLSGVAIPTATDIAFSLGILSILGRRVPPALKIFLTALAIIDDLGAIAIIALFYTKGFSLLYFSLAILIFIILVIMNKTKVHSLYFYILPGIVMWYFMLRSGVHATISGILLAFAIPFGHGRQESPSSRLQHLLHRPVAWIILPVFALANTGILLTADWQQQLISTNALGIIAGLFLGKPLGIVLFCFLAVKAGICRLPFGVSWHHIIGAGTLAGIGFTMSIFITLLAFTNEADIVGSKMAILIASIMAGITGFMILKVASKKALTKF